MGCVANEQPVLASASLEYYWVLRFSLQSEVDLIACDKYIDQLVVVDTRHDE